MNKKSIYLGLGLLAATLNLSAEVVTAHIPFAFVAGGKSLPAGNYSIEAISPGVVLVEGVKPSEHAFLLFTASASRPGAAGINFDRSGVTPQLSSVHTSTESWQFVIPASSKPGPAAAVALRSKK